ncbi:MAG: hypothetical protein ACFFE1_04190 [Candidatus Thorarchaeota archaeon]
MGSRQSSILICVIILSGILYPLITHSNGLVQSGTHQGLSNRAIHAQSGITHSWFHDGSNMTGFGSPIASMPSVGSISSSGSYLYASDVGSGSGWHGPVMSYTLEESFKVSQLTSFDIDVGFDCYSDTSRLGAVDVFLHDSNEDVICRYVISDAWADDRQLKLPFTWWFADETGYTTPYSEPDWVTFSPYHETLTLSDTMTGFQVVQPDIGTFEFTVSEQADLERIVSYVTVAFYGYESWTYCEEVFLHSILLEWTGDSVVEEPITSAWHHDCSNTTDLTYNNTFPLPWLNGVNTWTITTGEMLSSGDYLYFENIPSASSGWHGPLWVHEFEEPFSVSQIHNFTVDLFVDNSLAAYGGKIQVILLGEEFRPVFRAYVGDAWDNVNEGHIFAEYMESDGTYHRHGLTDVGSFTSFDGVMQFTYDELLGVSAFVHGYGIESLFSPEGSELTRKVTHVMILTGRLSGLTYMPSQVHDIYVDWVSEGVSPPEDVLTIDHPLDIFYYEGETGNNITWTPTSIYPGGYLLYVNDEGVEADSWLGDPIVVDVDGLDPGVYNYTIVVFNTNLEYVTDEVVVTVETPGSPTAEGTLIIIGISIGSIVVIVVIIGAVCRSKGEGVIESPSGYEW